MKRQILFAGLVACALGASAQTGYMKDITVSGKDVQRQGGEVVVRMNLDLSGVKMKQQHTAELVPVLVSKDGTQEQAFPSIVVNGKIRNRALKREEALTGNPRYTNVNTTIRRKNGEPQSVDYQATAPFEKWMYDGRLEVREAVTGCAECDEGGETSTVDPLVLPRFIPNYVTALREPAPEPVKRRDEVRSARLQYRQDSHNVLPGYKNNRAELASVQASIDAVKENKDLTITGIYVTGYASPEAPVAYNMELSKRRAQKFVAYVQKQNPELDQSLWHVDWKGEDWIGLRKEVEKHPRLLKQDEVLRIIDQCTGDQDACEEKIKALVPPEIYQRVLNEMYGPLRRNEYRIEYNVRHFDLEEARGLLHSRPDLLSVAEIQKVADSYGRNTDAYREALQVAVKTYPDNVTARNNAALAEIETGHYAEAIALLKDAQDASLVNLLGVAYFKNGQMQEAADAFRRAQAAGYAGAADNLKMLEEARELLGE